MVIRDTNNTRDFWERRLNSKTDYHDIAKEIHWGFSELDLAILADFHKNAQYREKIENLLIDCNFHTESADLANGNYDKFPKLATTYFWKIPVERRTTTNLRIEAETLEEAVAIAKEKVANSSFDSNILYDDGKMSIEDIAHHLEEHQEASNLINSAFEEAAKNGEDEDYFYLTLLDKYSLEYIEANADAKYFWSFKQYAEEHGLI